jgi:hypothetical protein
VASGDRHDRELSIFPARKAKRVLCRRGEFLRPDPLPHPPFLTGKHEGMKTGREQKGPVLPDFIFSFKKPVAHRFPCRAPRPVV